MRKVYNDNGLPFFEYIDIRDRQFISKTLEDTLVASLLQQNRMWQFYQIEAPCLIPGELISTEYTSEDLHKTQDFVLRPETTPASYAYAKSLIEHQESQPPFCVWQLAKSFRRENDQVTANVRLKEFYQQEFQCIYSADTKNDYQKILPELLNVVEQFTGKKARIIESDRLPHYSQKTLDIEVKLGSKWLEVCSSSIRTDVYFGWKDKKLKNVEFAFGIDRLLYARKDSHVRQGE